MLILPRVCERSSSVHPWLNYRIQGLLFTYRIKKCPLLYTSFYKSLRYLWTRWTKVALYPVVAPSPDPMANRVKAYFRKFCWENVNIVYSIIIQCNLPFETPLFRGYKPKDPRNKVGRKKILFSYNICAVPRLKGHLWLPKPCYNHSGHNLIQNRVDKLNQVCTNHNW